MRPWTYYRVQRPAGRPDGGACPTDRRDCGGRAAAIDVDEDGLRHRSRIGSAIDFEIEDIVPFGVQTGEPVRFSGMFHPAGSDLTMAEARQTKINAFAIQYEGKTGLSKSGLSGAA